jgi:hypothetical protein
VICGASFGAAVCGAWLAFWMPVVFAADAAEVIIEAISKPCMAGTFTRGAAGLHFRTCKDGPVGSVLVSALAGEELIYIRQESGDLLISVQSRAFTLRVPVRELEEAGTLASPLLAFRKLDAAAQVWGDATAIAELRRAPEYALLPELSYQLGKLGITGRAYPPSLVLHAIALGAAKQLGIEPDQPDAVCRFQLPSEFDAGGVDLLQSLWPDACDSPKPGLPNVERRSTCPNTCEAFPNRDQDCFGMCGPGCDRCWPWVCGDCCYHGFCAVHDELLRACENSANPIACLHVLPWYFILGGCDELLFKRPQE